MNQTVKICNLTNLEASLKDVSSANLVVLMAPSAVFEQCVGKMKDMIPNVPNIGVCGQGYYQLKDYPEDIILVGFTGCQVIADVISDVNKPILSVQKLMDDVEKIQIALILPPVMIA